jgi:hypothetical protein
VFENGLSKVFCDLFLLELKSLVALHPIGVDKIIAAVEEVSLEQFDAFKFMLLAKYYDFEMQNYSQAVKCYQRVLETTVFDDRMAKKQICRNYAHALMRIGHLCDSEVFLEKCARFMEECSDILEENENEEEHSLFGNIKL